MLLNRRKQLAAIVLAGVVTMNLLGPGNAWADTSSLDSTAESTAESSGEEAAVYSTTEPKAAESGDTESVEEEKVSSENSEGSSSENASGESSGAAGTNTGSGSAGESESEKESSTSENYSSGTQVTEAPTAAPTGTASGSSTSGASSGTESGSTSSSASGTTSGGTSGTASGTASGGTESGTTASEHTLSIEYVYSDGTEAAPSYSESVSEGANYSVSSPKVSGATADTAAVSGIMGKVNISVTVTYSRNQSETTPAPQEESNSSQYTLTINYRDTNGSRVSDSYVGTYKKGAEYYVESPDIDGYYTDKEAVSGTMQGDKSVTVVYYADPEPVPKPTQAPSVSAAASALISAAKNTSELSGFTQIAKKYAYANVRTFLNIREGKGTDSRIVGVLYPKNLCYVIADEDQDWVYVESGTVRGFVYKNWLTIGTEADQYVKQTGEDKCTLATQLVAPADNQAFRYTLTTTRTIPTSSSYTYTSTSANRQAMITFAEQFLGHPYVWGGTDLLNGCDCSGFTQQVYAAFGIAIPRCSYEQAEAGTKILATDAEPGDLIFYARNGVVYHVLMYIGNGQAVNASSSTTGIIISNVDYTKACWACRFINDGTVTSTQASSLVEIGKKAYEGDSEAQQKIIAAIATASNKEWSEYGFCRSVLIAQVIQESGWLSFSGAANGGIQPSDNNIIGMNASLLNGSWTSPWTGTSAIRYVPQNVNGTDVYDYEEMRTYPDIESCLEDYAAFKVGLHQDIKGVTDTETVINTGLAGYATDPAYYTSVRNLITKYGLTRYDSDTATGTYNKDSSVYTQDQLELIWAVVAQEDDVSYDGALAVISCAMNRADQNYGGYGTTALAQLTADGQFCYSPKVSDPSLWQARLNGNVADYVKQAVSDCLSKGVRNHSYMNFRSSNRTGSYIQIGSNWFF